MTSNQIEKFVEPNFLSSKALKIDFKTRNSLVGLFIEGYDYKELKSKNFWRIVTGPNIENWKTSKDINLARIFNGLEMTRINTI